MPSDSSRDFRWLLGESAASLLEQAAQGLAEQQNVLAIVKGLRKSTTPSRAAIVLEQAQLRIRGRNKFQLADQMFFTRRGLEQATSESLARYKANRFTCCDRVADVCCGIGGDLIGLAGRDGATATVGIDIDETTSLFASRNVTANELHQQGEAWVQQLSFEKLNLNGFQGLHLDPDRRVKRRAVRGNHFQPSLPDVLNRVSPDQLVSIKVAPATPSESDWPQAMQREWIGDRRECKQQVLWLGERYSDDRVVTATMVDGKQPIVSFSAGEAARDQSVAAHDAVGEFVYEPHPTILAARLTDPFAHHLGLTRISAALPYLTGRDRVEHGLISGFEVLEVTKLQATAIDQALERFDLGILEIKHRGVDAVTAKKIQRIRGSGSENGVVLVTRVGKQYRAIIARRI